METSAAERILMIEIQRLDGKDYEVLKNVADGTYPNPQASIAIVAVSGEEIIGRVFLVAPVHIEGPWIREGFRNGTVLKRMIDRLEIEAKQAGLTQLLAFGNSETEDYIQRLNFSKMPLSVWEKSI